MPQQINLCIPILLTQKRYFSAQTLVQVLAVFMLLGGGLSAYWVWSLNVASEGFKKTLAIQAGELASLQAAIAQGKAGSGLDDAALAKDLQERRAELQHHESQMDELQHGLFRPGWGHSARLQLLAQSIPAQVWVTEVKADEGQLNVSGFTLEPAALNDWVAKLAASPLLQAQKLSTVQIDNTSAALTKTAVPATAARAVWSFNLLMVVAQHADVIVAGRTP